MNDFNKELFKKYSDNLSNNFGIENYDEITFGKYVPPSFNDKIKSTINNLLIKTIFNHRKNWLYDGWANKYGNELNKIYNKLNESSKKLLVDIIAFRMMGYKKIKLPLNNPAYWENIKKVDALKQDNEYIVLNESNYKLYKFNLNDIGYNISLYFVTVGVVIDFIIQQYKYENGNFNIQAEEGDIVLDLGACWGDTALYFANNVGEFGKVFSFEFIPNNIKVFNLNLELNPFLKNRIKLINSPASNKSDVKIYYEDNGPSSKISETEFENQTGYTKTISIDDFVRLNGISKIDFIKMDIEGAEPYALEGAINTIKKFKPKLAIAIYHSMDDFINIPNWILNLNCGYKLFLNHNTIHAQETVIFAKVDD